MTCRILCQCVESILQERQTAPGKGSTPVYEKNGDSVRSWGSERSCKIIDSVRSSGSDAN